VRVIAVRIRNTGGLSGKSEPFLVPAARARREIGEERES
jgi:hypothetical protein